MSKKTLSVRIDPVLHTKVYADVNSNAYIVEKALKQFYRGKEPNQKVFTDAYTNANDVYDVSLVQLLQDQVQDLKLDKSMLLHQVQEKDRIIALQSLGFVGRMRYLLESKK